MMIAFGVMYTCLPLKAVTFFADILFLVCCAASWVRLQVQTGQRAVQPLKMQQTWILRRNTVPQLTLKLIGALRQRLLLRWVALWSLMMHTPSLGIYMMFTVLCAARDM